MPENLAIHVIGTGYGESVIVEFPDRSVGIVDSVGCRTRASWEAGSSSEDHPIIRFIEDFIHPPRIRFVLLTHPHADHCLGIGHLLQHFGARLERVIIPTALLQTHTERFRDLIIEQTRKLIPDPAESLLGLKAGRVARELKCLEDEIKRLKRRYPEVRRYYWQGDSEAINFGDIGVKICPLTPGSDALHSLQQQVEKAHTFLATNLAANVAECDANVSLNKYPHPDYNLASVAVCVGWQKAQIVLSADAFDSVWDEAFDNWSVGDRAHRLLKCEPMCMLKVGHHGSQEWRGGKLGDFLNYSKCGMAVVTPFRHGNVALPTPKAIHELRQATTKIATTVRQAAIDSTGLSWDAPSSSKPLPPGRWLEFVRQNPKYAALLSSDPQEETSLPMPPQPWLDDIRKQPELARCLPKLLRQERPEHDNRVSCYFDAEGNHVQGLDYYGSATGIFRPT
jgi:ribonuclease BN (tRNA processing enzyme)